MAKHGFTELVGVDVSQAMLDGAAATNVYKSLHKTTATADGAGAALSEFAGGDQVDVLVCVGTTTYLDPTVLHAWVKLVKPAGNGYIVFTHKTAVWPEWEPLQSKLVADNVLECVHLSAPLPYLPSFGTAYARDEERAKIYAYRRL